jgi:hypothetical protein
MNDSFGNLSGFNGLPTETLPAGYGGAQTKSVQSIHAPDPSYEGIFDDWKLFGETGTMGNPVGKSPPQPTVPRKSAEALEKEVFLGGIKEFFQNISSSGPPEYRDVRGFDSSYLYRQYGDKGKIEIREGKNTGSTYTSGTQWAALTSEIEKVGGPYPTGGSSGSNSDRAEAIGTGVGAAAAQLLPALAQLLGPQEPNLYDPGAEILLENDDPEIPWGLILGGVAVLGVIGTGITLMVKQGD